MDKELNEETVTKVVYHHSNKKQLLKDTFKLAIEKSKYHSQNHKKLKGYDDIIEAIAEFLSGTSIVLMISGFSMPLLFIIAAACNGCSFVLRRVQNALNLKIRYNLHKRTSKQYDLIGRELLGIINANNLSDRDILRISDEFNTRISIIQESEEE